MASKVSSKQKALVVTTNHKGVFFGYADPLSLKNGEMRLTKARMAIYWSTDVKGVLGLAATGPSASCRISVAAPALTVNNVDAVIECSAEAIVAWEKGPWRG